VAVKGIAVKKYVVKLSVKDRARLAGLIRGANTPRGRLNRARILWRADAEMRGKDGATARSPRL
jgi:hypothetical protein